MAKIMLVDDERLLIKGLKRSLEAAGFIVLTAFDGIEALDRLAKTSVDLVVLDLMLPKLDGLEVCRRLRQFSQVPVIMLTAKGEDVDKIVGLELGADDYLTKPFNTRELIARIKAVLRRFPSPDSSGIPSPSLPGKAEKISREIIWAGGLEIDVARQKISIDGQNIELTVREFDLLQTIAKHPGRIYTREMLLEQVWGANYYGEPRVVDVYIRRLRQKIEREATNPRWIKTRWGAGYYFQE